MNGNRGFLKIPLVQIRTSAVSCSYFRYPTLNLGVTWISLGSKTDTSLCRFWAQVLSWWAHWPAHKDTFISKFESWEHVDLTVYIGIVTGQHGAHRSSCCHSPIFKIKASLCSAHWAYQHDTWAQKGRTLTDTHPITWHIAFAELILKNVWSPHTVPPLKRSSPSSPSWDGFPAGSTSVNVPEEISASSID